MDTNIRHFDFFSGDINVDILPFRIGDIVRVENWGWTYSESYILYNYFTNSRKIPYYSTHEGRFKRGGNIHFKIIGFCYFSCDVIAYLRDRQNQDVTIGVKGLELVKQYPLRIGETTVIKLEKIKEI